MDGDLSLSQSFGGLRIANPDDGSSSPLTAPAQSSPSTLTELAPSLPTANEASSDPQSRRHSIFNLLRRGDPVGELSTANPPFPLLEAKQSGRRPTTDFELPQSQADSLNHASVPKDYRVPTPMQNHEQQQQAIYASYQSNPMQNGGRTYPMGNSGPALGGYTPQPPNPGPDRPRGSYRIRSESTQSSVSEIPTRSNSRSAGAAMQAGTETRDSSHRDRSYSQNHPIPSGGGALPPRRSSRGMGGGHLGQQQIPPNGGSTYGLDGPLMSSSEEWKEKGAAVGLRAEIDSNGKPVLRSVKKGVKDFNFGRTLGEGSYSTVLAATDRQTLKEYAVKVLDKRHIIKEKKIKYVNIEKNTLNRLTEHPGIVRLYYTFQDEKSLYYVLDVASGGELLGVLKKMGTFNEECTRFYGAQILDAIEYMHSRGVIHRDLKPENVLLDDQMHVKITDFGTAKLLKDPLASSKPGNGRGVPDMDDTDDDDNRATSFVGTAEYVSPELLTDKNACKASDLWAFGCIIYQLLSGRPPFKAANEYLTFQKIVSLDYEFPQGFPPTAKDLVERLLVLDPSRRLSLEHVKNHEFFDSIKWGRSLWRQKAPRLKPYVPPAKEPNVIQLNGYSPQPIAISRSAGQSNTFANGTSKPQPRVITELPPPTQLDIEWSPVLTRNNERILKLGNLMVLSTPMPNNSPRNGGEQADGHRKLSRFFGGSTTKKRQRLVMVTSSGRIILAAAGGDEKKSKTEISLLDPECVWRTQIDTRGQMIWCVDVRGIHYTFEDTKPTKDEPDSGMQPPEEWIETIERAKDFAISQSMLGSYNSDAGFDMSSSVSSPSSTLGGGIGSIYPEGFSVADRAGRKNISKSQASLQEDSTKRHRFSKRTSKNGLAAVF